MTGFYDHGNEPLDYINNGIFPDQLSKYKPSRNHMLWSYNRLKPLVKRRVSS
jgi:hypothetical protein